MKRSKPKYKIGQFFKVLPYSYWKKDENTTHITFFQFGKYSTFMERNIGTICRIIKIEPIYNGSRFTYKLEFLCDEYPTLDEDSKDSLWADEDEIPLLFKKINPVSAKIQAHIKIRN